MSRQFQDKLAAELLLFKEQLRFVFSKRRLRELLVDDCVRAECCVFESRLNPALYFSNVPRCSIKQVLDVRKILAYETCLLRLCLALFAMRHLCLLLLHLLAPSHLRTQVLRQPDVELGSVRGLVATVADLVGPQTLDDFAFYVLGATTPAEVLVLV